MGCKAFKEKVEAHKKKRYMHDTSEPAGDSGANEEDTYGKYDAMPAEIKVSSLSFCEFSEQLMSFGNINSDRTDVTNSSIVFGVAAPRLGVETLAVHGHGMPEGLRSPSSHTLEPMASRAGFGGIQPMGRDAKTVVHLCGDDGGWFTVVPKAGKRGFQPPQRREGGCIGRCAGVVHDEQRRNGLISEAGVLEEHGGVQQEGFSFLDGNRAPW